MTTRNAPWRMALVRGTAALTAVLTVFTVRAGQAGPGDIFTIPAPALGADPPPATDLKTGDATVSTQTGALEWSFTIETPPGRAGMAPQVALVYSSQAPTYGGISAGWSLPIPIISEDRSYGRMENRSLEIEQTQADPKADDRFVSSMAGGRPLVAVDEPGGVEGTVYKSYRAMGDSSWVRYERMNASVGYRWRARTTDGVVHWFGNAARMPSCPVSDQFAPLTDSIDAFGNAISYDYTWLSGECVLTKIQYGQSPTTPAFAQIDFIVKRSRLCNGVETGSQSDYRSGVKIVTGANQVDQINVRAIDPANGSTVHTRQFVLTYDESTDLCDQTHAPFRQLDSIQQSAWGVDSPRVDLPPITFGYNDATTTLVVPDPLPTVPWGGTPALQNLGWGYRRTDDRWPTVESMFVDLDGDGLQDLVTNTSVVPGSSPSGTVQECKATWRRNLGPGANGALQNFGAELPIKFGTAETLPRLKWAGDATPIPVGGASMAATGFPQLETCALNGQVTAYRNSDEPGSSPQPCHNNTACGPGSDPQDPEQYCFPGGTDCPPGEGGVDNVGDIFRTYLAYRWLDADGDGLADLVAAPHGSIDIYDIERGNRPGYNAGEQPLPGIPGVGEWPACSGLPETCVDLGNCLYEHSVRDCSAGLCTVDWEEVNSCVAQSNSTACAQAMMAKSVAPPEGAPPPGNIGIQRAPYMRCEGRYPWLIYKNTGKGEFSQTPTIKYQPIPLESANGDSSFGGPIVASESHAIMDFDGDSFPDAVIRDPRVGGTAALQYNVWLGDGTGGFSQKAHRFLTRPMNCPFPCNEPGDNAISGIGGVWGTDVLSSRGLMDFNGDGLPDHWMQLDGTGNADIAFNDGVTFRLFGPVYPPVGDLATPNWVKPGNDQYVFSTYPPVNPIGHFIRGGLTKGRSRVTDVDGDGRPDIITWNQPYPPSPPFPPQPPDPLPSVHYNVGGQFMQTSVPYSGDSFGAKRTTWAIGDQVTDDEELTWKLSADLLDLDGDGVDEAVYFTDQGTFVRSNPSSTQPRRLLSSIDGGRGRRSTFTYSQMHDPSVITQNPDQFWWDGRPKASPRSQWVVKSIATTDAFATPTTATSTYFYKNPRYAAGDHGYGFRGFEEVITTRPGVTGVADGSKTINRYDYQVVLRATCVTA